MSLIVKDQGKWTSTCLSDGHAAGSTDQGSRQAAIATATWRLQAEYEGPVKVLHWGGVGRATAEWQRQYAVLYRGKLYFLESKQSLEPTSIVDLFPKRYSHILRININSQTIIAREIGRWDNLFANYAPLAADSLVVEFCTCLDCC